MVFRPMVQYTRPTGETIMANPLSERATDQIAADIVRHFIFKQDMADLLSGLAGELVNDVIPYTGGTTPSVDDLHVDVAGLVSDKIAQYIKQGFGQSIKPQGGGQQ